MNRSIAFQNRVQMLAVLAVLVVFAGCAPTESPRPDSSSLKEGTLSARPTTPPVAQPAVPAGALKQAVAIPISQPEPAKPEIKLAANSDSPPWKSEDKQGDGQANEKQSKEEKPSPFAGAKWKADDAEDEARRPKPRDLGPPLIDHPEKLSRLHPVFPTWLDPKRRMIVMVGEVVRSSYGLEMFISTRAAEKGYESVIEVDTQAAIIHAALLGLGLEPGTPVKFIPQYKAPTGPEIEIELYWKDDKGQVQHARAQDWLKSVHTGKPLQSNWVFTGSGFWKDETTGKEYFQAEGGYLVCVANTPSALLDLPIPSTGDLDSREFQPADSVPPRGTPVTIVLKPKK
jgi:hypothetical protein